MPNWKRIVVSGSDATLNTLTVSNGITGSLFGTASYATQALSASFAPSTPAFPFTGSAVISGSLNVIGITSLTGGVSGNTRLNGNLVITGSTTSTGEIIFGSGASGIIRFGPTSGAIFAASTSTGTTLYPASANLVSFGDQQNGNPLMFRFFCNSTSTYGLSIGTGGLATARLHIAGGTAVASTAPIKLTAGTNLTTPEAGTIEFNGSNLFFTTGSTRSTILTNISPASITGSAIITGSLTVTGSFNVTGLTARIGNTTLNGNLIVTGSLLLSGSSLVAGITPIPLAGTIQDGVTSVLGNLYDWNSNFYQGTVLYSEIAGGTITFGQLCYRTQNETWELADATAANSAAAFNMLGICVKSSTSTNPTSILINGFVETATYATIVKSGEPLYMATTAGSMTKTAPTTVGNAVRLIGHTFWDSNTNSKIIIRFNPENSWIEL